MNELNRHDRLLKKILENQMPPYDPSTWNILDDKLNRLYTEEQPAPVADVDKAMYNTLNRLAPPYAPDHWMKLANELRWIARMRRNLFAAKTLELAAVLLFLWYLDGALPVYQGPKLPEQAIAANAQPGQAPDQTRETASDLQSTSVFAEIKSIHAETTVGNLKKQTSATDFANNAALLHLEMPISADNGSVSISTEQNTAAQAAITMMASLDQIPVLQPLPLSKVALNFKPSDFSKTNPKVVSVKPNRRFFLGVHSGLDVLRIQTPLDDVYGKSGYVQYGLGYNAGVLTSWRRGRWGIETGLSYISKRYNPKPDVEIFGQNLNQGYLASSLETVDLDVLSIPLRFTGRIGSIGKFSLHGLAGASYHLALQADFIYSTYRYTQGSPADEGPVNTRPVLPSTPQFRVTGVGVLDGGEFRENSQFVVDAGVRLEHTFWPRFAAFLEPTINYSISKPGVGPKQDRLSGLSVRVGVLTNL